MTGLLTGSPVRPGTPHITGVRTADGNEIRADVVIDAMGRRSKIAEWLGEVGARGSPAASRGLRLQLLHPLFQRNPSRDDRPSAGTDRLDLSPPAPGTTPGR